MLEVDFNNNPLRSLIVDPMLDKSSGSMELGKGFGLGIEFDFSILKNSEFFKSLCVLNIMQGKLGFIQIFNFFLKSGQRLSPQSS